MARSTISTSLKTRCARCAATCRRGTTSCCPSSRYRRSSGYPRVYALALALVAHTDSELDETRIARFVRAFQEGAPLDDRRALGVADDASPRAPGKPQAPVGEDDLEVGRTAPGRTVGEERRRLSRSHRRPRPRTAGRGESAAALTELSDPFVVRLLQLLRDQGRAIKALEHLEDELAAQWL